MLFYKTYLEKSNINQKLLIWSKDKITKKCGKKKLASFVLGKVYDNCSKVKEKCYFTKPTSKRVIYTGNHLFGPMI